MAMRSGWRTTTHSAASTAAGPAGPHSGPPVSHTARSPRTAGVPVTEAQHPRPDSKHDRLDSIAELAVGRGDRDKLVIE
jgi:hypothetical protein